METISINGTQVFVFDSDDWSKATLIGLALNSEEFTIEHEQDADYGRLEIFTLNDGLWATVREIDERQIENEEPDDRFGLAFVKTVDRSFYRLEDSEFVRFWKVEAFERDGACEESEDIAGEMFPELA